MKLRTGPMGPEFESSLQDVPKPFSDCCYLRAQIITNISTVEDTNPALPIVRNMP